MKRRMLALVVTLVATLMLANPVSAGVQWCETDPIITLNGGQYQILVAVPQDYASRVNGPIDVEVKTPEQTATQLVVTDAGFNGHGEVVRFTGLDPNNQYQFQIKVPIDDSGLADSVTVPVRVIVNTPNDDSFVVEGTSDGTTVTVVTSTNYSGGSDGGAEGD